jgi:hypothetical protein
LPSKNPYRQCG